MSRVTDFLLSLNDAEKTELIEGVAKLKTKAPKTGKTESTTTTNRTPSGAAPTGQQMMDRFRQL